MELLDFSGIFNGIVGFFWDFQWNLCFQLDLSGIFSVIFGSLWDFQLDLMALTGFQCDFHGILTIKHMEIEVDIIDQ